MTSSPTWPPQGRPPTAQELADGRAVEHDDGTFSWSPTNADFNWSSRAEERASGLPAAYDDLPGLLEAMDADARELEAMGADMGQALGDREPPVPDADPF
ncbi:hypothetical protein [Actinoplanes sp. G11-F43]|uniref:hypothetical protein n=1 Tax=Actinoplanes sp. G11-F43 TaxID=3424130 RepID=UPI003D34DD80